MNRYVPPAIAAILFVLAGAPAARAQMNMSLFKDDPATAATATAATPGAAAPGPAVSAGTAPGPAAVAIYAGATGGAAAVPVPAPVAATANPGANPGTAATSAGAAATPSCPAGKDNPASDQANREGLPYSLQKLYALRLPSFTAADLDCDGFLDGKEIKAMVDAKFDAADTNRDGVISEAEAQGVIGDFEESAASNGSNVIVAPRATTLKHRLAAMDADQDGVITRAEFEAYYQARYQKLDRDGDGRLDITEYQTDDEDNRRLRNNSTTGTGTR